MEYGMEAANLSQEFSNYIQTRPYNKFSSSTFSMETHKFTIVMALHSKALSTKKLYSHTEVGKWPMFQAIPMKESGPMANFKALEHTSGKLVKSTMETILKG